jgi:Undecaprenyl-phosphate glucose phosphotransferase
MSTLDSAGNNSGPSPVQSSLLSTPPWLTAKSIRRTRLLTLLMGLASLEFLVVTCTAYVGVITYYWLFLAAWPPSPEYLPVAPVIATTVLVLSLMLGSFSTIQSQSQLEFVWRGLCSVGLTFFFFLSAMFVLKVTSAYSRGTFFTQLVLVAIAVALFRAVAFRWVQAAISAGRVEASRLAIIGDELNPAILNPLIQDGVQIVRTYPFPSQQATSNPGSIDNWNIARNIVADCRFASADDVLLVPAEGQLQRTIELMPELSQLPASLHVIPRNVLEMFGAVRPGRLGTSATIQLVRRPLSTVDLFVKRAFDLLVALVGLILLSPMLLIVAAAIKLDSPGPILFRQTRHGYNNGPIRVFKFRTMNVVEDSQSFKQARQDDPRVTLLGRILRRTNIDELPQLLNVVLGDMSIVGPRPHPVALNKQYERRLTPFMRRHNIKPGITGWAQVNGCRGETDTVEKMKRRLEFDLYYLDNWSLVFDIQIIILTLVSKKAYTNAY